MKRSRTTKPSLHNAREEAAVLAAAQRICDARPEGTRETIRQRAFRLHPSFETAERVVFEELQQVTKRAAHPQRGGPE